MTAGALDTTGEMKRREEEEKKGVVFERISNDRDANVFTFSIFGENDTTMMITVKKKRLII